MNIFKKYILIPLAAVFSVTATAQDNYAHLEKNATFNYETQEGEITLESYVTGVMKVTQEAKPVDVVLVLDYSGSMTGTSGAYTPSSGEATSYTSTNTATQYTYNKSGSNPILGKTISYNGVNYSVQGLKTSDKIGNEMAWAWIVVNSQRYYLQPAGDIVKAANNTDPTSSSYPTAAIDGRLIYPTYGSSDIIWTSYSTSTVTIDHRIDALRSAVNNFIDEIASHATNNSVDDQISIVTFSGSGATGETQGWPTFSIPNLETNTTKTSSATDYVTSGSSVFLRQGFGRANGKYSGTENSSYMNNVIQPFTSVGTQHDINVLKHALNIYEPAGATASERGVKLAKLMLDTYSRKTNNNVAKVVIVFTDGIPEATGGYNWSTDASTAGSPMWTANSAIGQCKEIKGYSSSHDNFYIYTIYCNSSNPVDNTVTYMNYMSSNYPNATNMTTPGSGVLTGTDAKYYKQAKDNLETVFASLTGEVTAMAGTQYGTETLLKDFVNNTYFKMPDDIVQSDVKVYEQACTSVTGTSPNIVYGFDNLCIDEGTGANRCWHKGATEAAAATSTRPKLDIKIQRVGDTGYDGTQDRVLISGYDYSADDNWCGLRKDSKNTTGTPGGHRLVVKFPFVIKVQKDSTATGALKTNGEDSGIYEAIEDSNGKMPGETGYQETYADTAATNYPMPVIYFASLNISRDSLDMGESAIYDIYQTLPDSAETKVGRLSINGSGNGSDSKIMYGLAGGVGVKYRVVETDWNWAYHSSGTTQEHSKTIEQKSSTETTVPKTSSLDFKFDGNHITPAKAEEDTSPYSMFNHDEEYKVNTMTIPSH